VTVLNKLRWSAYVKCMKMFFFNFPKYSSVTYAYTSRLTQLQYYKS